MVRPFLMIVSTLAIGGMAHGKLCQFKLKNGQTLVGTEGSPMTRGAKRIFCYDSVSRNSDKPKSTRRIGPRRDRERPSKEKKSWSSVKRPGKLERLRDGRTKTSSSARERAKRYVAFVKTASETYSIEEPLIWAIMRTESHFDPTVVSNKGAHGLMQLLPQTAKSMGVTDIFDPEQNIMGGVRYLRVLANRFDGDMPKVIAGYHAGGGAVSAANGIPYERTAEYLRRVLNAYYTYKTKSPADDP